MRETIPTHAEYVAEMARQVVFEAYGEDAYTKGLTVYTTIRKADQEAAYAAVRRGVHRLRPPPRLSRARGVRQPAGRRRRTRSRRSSGSSRTQRQRRAGPGRRPRSVRRPRSRRCSPTARRSRSPATASSSPRGRWATRRPRRPASGRGAVIRRRPRRQGTLGDRAGPAGRVGVRLDAAAPTARSCRSSAASTSTAASSIT